MIDLYTANTPNGHKIPIMLEETGLKYNLHLLDLSKGDQKKPEFLQINPNGKIPAIVDQNGPDGKLVNVFESGAILIYLAEKSGSLLAQESPTRYKTLQWLMFQMSALGPMTGQAFHFSVFASEKMPYAIDRYTGEVKRMLTILNQQLGEYEYLAGEYSIADIATWPWIEAISKRMDASLLDGHLNLQRWAAKIAQRPAVVKAMSKFV
jgi:GSH-dependent disulfide-bond oxidoreductase